MTFDNKQWMEAYRLALLEVEQAILGDRIACARDEMNKRIQELRLNCPNTTEERAILDALANLRVLEKESTRVAS
jgi:hypothetical protein